MQTMKNGLLVLTVAVLLLVFVVTGAGLQPTEPADSGIKILSFHTDKEVYHSNEEMTLFVSLYSPEELNKVLIRVLGVKSTKGVYFVSFSNETYLVAGENKLILTKQLPSCSKCAGIDQGTYFINLSVAYDGEVVEATHSIAITPKPDQIIAVDIIVEEAKRMSDAENLTLLDVRTEEEYDAAHIDGALSMPIVELSNRTDELNKSSKIVVYSEDGSNSTTACTILLEKGFERVYNMLGGINAWNESGYPLVHTTAPEQPGFDVVLALAAVLIGAYWMRRRGL